MGKFVTARTCHTSLAMSNKPYDTLSIAKTSGQFRQS